MKINEKHLIEGDGIIQIQGDKRNGVPFKFKKKSENFDKADTLVVHYTAGGSGKSSANYLAGDATVASAHVVIDRDGTIYQVVPFNFKANHAGKSTYAGRTWLNQYSIGIELANAGPLKKVGTEYISWFKSKYQENEVIKAIHRNETTPRYWHNYTKEQIQKCEELSTLLIKKYGIGLIVGHEEISPGRKQDPGPAYPLDEMRNRLLKSNRSDNNKPEFVNGVVDVSTVLNVREGAGSTFDKITKPLPDGSKVKVLEEENGWLKVKFEMEGWVSKAFVKENE